MVLSEFSYNDYIDIVNIIDESFVITESLDEGYEARKLADKLKKYTEKIKNKTVTEEDLTDTKETLEELTKVAKKINKRDYKVYNIIYIVTIVVDVMFFILELGDAINAFKHRNDPENLTMSKKDKIKTEIKSLFSLKTFISLGILLINSVIHDKFKGLMDYTKVVDKTYEILNRTEAKVMMEKRKAKKKNDTKTEEACDMVIEYVENMKRERMKQISIANKEKEKKSFNEGAGTELDVNMFKIACKDISAAISTEIENLRAYCNGAIFLARRALEINKSNKPNKITSMKNKIDRVESFVKDDNRYYDQNTLKNIFKRYEGFKTTKFSKYGIKAREKFEEKLFEAGEEIKKITNEYYKEMSIIATGKEGSSINSSIDIIKDKVSKQASYEISLEVVNLLNKIDDDARMTTDFCKAYIKWCREKTNAYDYKHSPIKFIFNKLFK